MRKITQQSVKAFLNGSKFHSANMDVAVEPFSDEATMYLHGNVIARRVRPVEFQRGTLTVRCPAQVLIYDGGWESNTTKERLNGLLELLGTGGCRVYQKNHTWYLSTLHGDVEWTGGAVFTASGEFMHMINREDI